MDDIESKTVIGYKRNVARVAKTGSEINGMLHCARRAGTVVATGKKTTSGQNKARAGPDHQHIAKLDRENEVAPPPKVESSVGAAIRDARASAKMSQKDLAQKINEKQSVIQDLESAKAISSPQILSKLEKILHVKLRGSDIGTPLNTVKKL